MIDFDDVFAQIEWIEDFSDNSDALDVGNHGVSRSSDIKILEIKLQLSEHDKELKNRDSVKVSNLWLSET